MRGGVRIVVERAVADHRARAEIEVEHRREAEVHAVRAQFARDRPAQQVRFGRGKRDVGVPPLAQRAHRRNRRESVAEPLHAAALVIDADEQVRRAQRANLRRKRGELRGVGVVALEQDDATDQRMREAAAIVVRELQSLDADDDRPARQRERAGHPGASDPRAAASRSSDFICRTASRNPVNTARDTIAWPMCSSRTPGSAATGCTLK